MLYLYTRNRFQELQAMHIKVVFTKEIQITSIIFQNWTFVKIFVDQFAFSQNMLSHGGTSSYIQQI
jgi:hypothetical protein